MKKKNIAINFNFFWKMFKKIPWSNAFLQLKILRTIFSAAAVSSTFCINFII
jgi:hypothetical protein